MLKLKSVAGDEFLKPDTIDSEVEMYSRGITLHRAKTPRTLHTWAIKNGFIFRRDKLMLFGGYYRHPQKDLYAAIV